MDFPQKAWTHLRDHKLVQPVGEGMRLRAGKVSRISTWISQLVRPRVNVEFFFCISSSQPCGELSTVIPILHVKKRIQLGRVRQLRKQSHDDLVTPALLHPRLHLDK